jgi:hypothetical protein
MKTQTEHLTAPGEQTVVSRPRTRAELIGDLVSLAIAVGISLSVWRFGLLDPASRVIALLWG